MNFKGIFLTTYLVLIFAPTYAEVPKLTSDVLELGCDIGLSNALKLAYASPGKFQLPVFSIDDDKKLIELLDQFTTAVNSKDSSAIDKTMSNLSSFSTSFYKKNANDWIELCYSLTKLRYEECPNAPTSDSCLELVKKRADGLALMQAIEAKSKEIFRRKYIVPDPSKEDSTLSSYLLEHPIQISIAALIFSILIIYILARRFNTSSKKS